ncbi:MAG: elongation factor P [Legionellales bacterium]|nr:elongation factor P [Legionellales bacterium]
MGTYSTNQFKSGLKIILDGSPYTIVENEFVKPGKGQAFNRVKLKNLLNSKVIEKTFKSGETVESADVIELELQYLYNDGENWHFMNMETYEQLAAGINAVKDAKLWISEQDICNVILWNNEPLLVNPPNFVNLKVIDTDPGVRGDTSSGGSKPATLETGAVVKVPLFVQIDELIKVDTRIGEYVSRVK